MSRSARTVAVVTGVGLALAIVYLLLPPMGTDLSAQAERGDFAATYGAAPVDFSWYGGTQQFGYSLVSPWLLAVLGARLTGALALVLGSAAFGLLLVRTQVARPMPGGVLGAACLAANLVSGRVTFGLGVAFGLLGLVALTLPRARLAGAATGAALAAATSPVAGLFTGLAGTALFLAGRRRDGAVLATAAAVPIVVVASLFNDGGRMPIGVRDTVVGVVTSLAAALLVPYRAVRIGALLSAAGVIAARLIDTPVGSNAIRLAVLFTIPVVAATAALRLRWLVPALVALAVAVPPVVVEDVRYLGGPATSREYFAPLIDELRRRAPVGRIEVPSTRNHWEAAYVAREVPLARGWLRQVDVARNPLFFDGSLSAETYRAWLHDNAVSYVALADARPSWAARAEYRLVGSGLPYLTEVWRSEHWRLFAVTGAVPLVSAPARLVASNPGGVTFDVDQPGSVLVRVRHSRWLSVSGPSCRLRADGHWVRLDVAAPGRYRIGSSLTPRVRC